MVTNAVMITKDEHQKSCYNVKRTLALAVMGASILLGACASFPQEDKYVLYRELMPRSILVFPPVNESVDVNASYSWLTTASQPIAEQGYYVFPVAVVDEFMKENGLPNPEDMHAAPLDKIGEIFGADAVMYVTIEEYGQKFELVQSTTRITARAELVDVGTGQTFWSDRIQYTDSGSSGNAGGGLLGAVISAAVAQVGNTIIDHAHDASSLANYRWFRSGRHHLLLGPANPGFENQMAEAEARIAEAATAEAAEEEVPAVD